MITKYRVLALMAFHLTVLEVCAQHAILSYTVSPAGQDLGFYWQDGRNVPFGSIQRLKDECESKARKLVFAMNGGMYNPDGSPKGLFIQQHHQYVGLDTAVGSGSAGNFYLQPNGVLLITRDKKAWIHTTSDLNKPGALDSVEFATQSGPMLVIDGVIHPAFKQGSPNLNIRNGVGLLPGNKLLFAMSKEPINFYDFAEFFLRRGCRNALYLDGFVSRTFLPEQGSMQTDGNFGVIIAVTEPAR